MKANTLVDVYEGVCKRASRQIREQKTSRSLFFKCHQIGISRGLVNIRFYYEFSKTQEKGNKDK